MTQLRTPNLNIEYKGGWCQKAVREAFSLPPTAGFGSAMADWQKGSQRFGNPPPGVSVPVYFSLGTESAGHVAIHLPDGRVASSTKEGFNKPLYIHPNMADLMRVYSKYFESCVYLGWSDEVVKTPVVQEEQEVTALQSFKEMHLCVFQSWPTKDTEDKWVKSGKPSYQFLQEMFFSLTGVVLDNEAVVAVRERAERAEAELKKCQAGQAGELYRLIKVVN